MTVQANSPEDNPIEIEDEALRGGFTQIPNAVLRRPDVSAGAKVAYMVLLSYAWGSGSCFPGQQTMAQDMGCSKQSVITYLKQLQEGGLIAVRRRGRGDTNIYTILRIRSQESVPLENEKSKKPKTRSQKSGLLEVKDFDPKNTQLEEDTVKKKREGGSLAHNEDAAMTGATAPPTQERVREIMGRAHASKRQRVKW